MMRRRDFITLLGGAAAAWPLAAHARQRERVRRIGMMMGAFRPGDPEGQRTPATFLDALEGLGWTLGGDFEVNTRWPADDADRRAAAAELAAWAPDVLVCCSRLAADMLARVTQTLPIVLAERAGVAAGSLIRRAALRVDGILKGERFADMVPPNLHAITDEVIE
jgi:putative ABC transport system substrate-binding protein